MTKKAKSTNPDNSQVEHRFFLPGEGRTVLAPTLIEAIKVKPLKNPKQESGDGE